MEKGTKINTKFYHNKILKGVLTCGHTNTLAKTIGHFNRTRRLRIQLISLRRFAKSCFWRCGTKICGLQILRLKPYKLLYVVNPGEKGLLYATHHRRLAEMLIVDVWDQNTVEELAAIVDNFPKRLRVCIATYGFRLENLLLNLVHIAC